MQEKINSKTTILVITRNRTHYVNRLLQYYMQTQCPFPIVIADSSDEQHLPANEAIIKAAKQTMQIRHDTYDYDMRAHEKIVRSMESIDSPYVVICAVDDYAVPNGIRDAINFLDANADYSVARGYAVWISQPETEKHLASEEVVDRAINQGVITLQDHPEFYRQDKGFPIELNPPAGVQAQLPVLHFNIDPYPQRTIDYNSARERLEEHLRDYTTTFYSLHRRDQLYQNLKITTEVTDEGRFGELLPSCLSVVQGKIKRLDSLFMVREWQARSRGHRNPTFADLLVENDFSKRYAGYRNSLVDALKGSDDVSNDEALNIVNRSFLVYLQKVLTDGSN